MLFIVSNEDLQWDYTNLRTINTNPNLLPYSKLSNDKHEVHITRVNIKTFPYLE